MHWTNAVAAVVVAQSCIMLFGASTAVDEPVPTPLPVQPPIVFPVGPVQVDPVPVPTPPPAPVPISALKADEWYVIQSQIPCLVLDSRQGIVSVIEEAGPIKIRGKFVDSGGRVETRTYDAKHVYMIEAVQKGEVELLVIPVGASDTSSVLRRTLTVMGTGPNPPPDPDIDPDPDVDPDPDPEPPPAPPQGIMVLLLYDNNSSREQLSTINSTEIVQWMDANCTKASDGRAQWRRWDKSSISKPETLANEDPIWKKLWDDIDDKVIADHVVIVTADTKVHMHPMAGPEDTLTFLKKIKEGK